MLNFKTSNVFKHAGLFVGIFLFSLSSASYAQRDVVAAGKNMAKTSAVSSQKALRLKLFRSLTRSSLPTRKLPSSYVLHEKYLLVSNNLQSLREQYIAKGTTALLSEEETEAASRLSNLTPIHQEGLPLLTSLSKQQKQLKALWEEALVQERNPNFLSRKTAADVLLFEVEPVTKMSELAISPRFFREWAALIDQSTLAEISETLAGLAGGLRADLINLEKDCATLTRIYLQAQEQAQNTALSAEEIMQAKKMMDITKGALRKVSHKAAQDVLDLVHLLNLYPSVSNDYLIILAGKLDELKEQNAFTKMLRSKIPIKKAADSEPRRIGFKLN